MWLRNVRTPWPTELNLDDIKGDEFPLKMQTSLTNCQWNFSENNADREQFSETEISIRCKRVTVDTWCYQAGSLPGRMGKGITQTPMPCIPIKQYDIPWCTRIQQWRTTNTLATWKPKTRDAAAGSLPVLCDGWDEKAFCSNSPFFHSPIRRKCDFKHKYKNLQYWETLENPNDWSRPLMERGKPLNPLKRSERLS